MSYSSPRLAPHPRIQFDKSVIISPPTVNHIDDSNGDDNHINKEENCFKSTVFSLPEIDEKIARKALIDHVINRYCYGKSAAKHMIITKMNNSSVFHYSLETFTETRSIHWSFEPYLGGHLDTSIFGKTPAIWEIIVEQPEAFESHSIELNIPHTDYLRSCHDCGGIRRKRCDNCDITGWETCYYCTGDGFKPSSFIRNNLERCNFCQGNGKRKCFKCNGDGMITCKQCLGHGQLRCHLKLTVNWINHVDDFITQQEEIAKERLRHANGQVVYQEIGQKLKPILNFPNSSITRASINIHKHHDLYLKSDKLVSQRQKVLLIPISKVYYSWKGRTNNFWVYGIDRRVFAPNYPQKCCENCYCSIC